MAQNTEVTPYKSLDLENAVKLYAIMIAEDIHEGRPQVHDRICQILGVSKSEFNPFIWNVYNTIHDPKHAEFLIRHRINMLNYDFKIKNDVL